MTAGEEGSSAPARLALLTPPALPRSPALLAALEWLGTRHGQRWLARGVWVLAGLGVIAALVVGADRPADPHLLEARAVALTKAHSHPSSVAGFNAVGFRVIQASVGGTGRGGCALLADTPARQAKGMMGRRDLAGYDAMIFRFPVDTVVDFYNQGVPIPLSLAWFDGSGVFIAKSDLAVCSKDCPRVHPNEVFRYALETPKGGLQRVGVGHGSLLLVGGTCG
jgi:uncharacterized membrane protein (UPF0127 family)